MPTVKTAKKNATGTFRYERFFWKRLKRNVICSAGPIWAWSEQWLDRPWTRQSATRPTTGVTFRAHHAHFVVKITTFHAPAAIIPNFTMYCAWKCDSWTAPNIIILHLPRKINLQLECNFIKIWRLPRKCWTAPNIAPATKNQCATWMQLHQILRLPRKVTVELHQYCTATKTECATRVHIHQIFRLPRNVCYFLPLLHFYSILFFDSALEVQRLFFEWFFRKDYCFSRDLLFMVFDFQGLLFVCSTFVWLYCPFILLPWPTKPLKT